MTEGFPQISAEHDCTVTTDNFAAHEAAIQAGRLQQAADIERETSDDMNRCGGVVVVNGIRECGLLHGNFQFPEHSPLSPDYKLFNGVQMTGTSVQINTRNI